MFTREKRLIRRFAFAILLLSSSALAWDVDRFDANYTITPDQKVVVVENIAVDLSDQGLHGIFRKIPFRYRLPSLLVRTVNIELKDVLMDGLVTIYHPENYQNDLYIRIGDPDRVLRGKHTFTLNYEVQDVFLNEDGAQIFFWNVTGDEWGVPIMSASATIALPDQASIKNLSATEGAKGSSPSDASTHVLDHHTIQVESSAILGPGYGLTVKLSLNPGSTVAPSLFSEIHKLFADNLEIYFPLVILLVNLFLFFLWKSRHHSGSSTSGSEVWEQFSPGQMSVLSDDEFGPLDISAEIIDLACKGYIKIEEKQGSENSSELTLTRTASGAELKPYKKELLESLFYSGSSVTNSDLNGSFYLFMPRIRDLLVKDLIDRGYYYLETFFVKKLYLVIFSILASAGLLYLVISLSDSFFIPFSLSLLLSAAIVFMFWTMLPTRTALGTKAYRQILAYRKYLEGFQQDRLKGLDPAAVFDTHLPFAIVLSLDETWAKKFKSLTEPPKWYGYSGGRIWQISYCQHLTNQTVPTLASTIPAIPKSSSGRLGGGFNSGGGGFGGGGGGAW